MLTKISAIPCSCFFIHSHSFVKFKFILLLLFLLIGNSKSNWDFLFAHHTEDLPADGLIICGNQSAGRIGNIVKYLRKDPVTHGIDQSLFAGFRSDNDHTRQGRGDIGIFGLNDPFALVIHTAELARFVVLKQDHAVGIAA